MQAMCNANEKFTRMNGQDLYMMQEFHVVVLFGRPFLNMKVWLVYWEIQVSVFITLCLITPFKPPINVIESRFNSKHPSEVVVIERIFGQLKKFPILGNCERVSLDSLP